MKKFIINVLIPLAIIAGIRQVWRSRDTLTDDHAHNVAVLRKGLAKANEDLPKQVDKETMLLRIEVTDGGIVNRYKLVNYTAYQISSSGVMDEVTPELRRRTCGLRLYKQAMDKGFSISYAYVGRDNLPASTITITKADCST